MIQMMKGELRQMDRNLGESWKERLMRGTQALVWGEKICGRCGKVLREPQTFLDWDQRLRMTAQGNLNYVLTAFRFCEKPLNSPF